MNEELEELQGDEAEAIESEAEELNEDGTEEEPDGDTDEFEDSDEPDADETEDAAEDGEAEPDAAEAGEVVVSIGEEPAPEPERAPEWVKKLRKDKRDADKRIRDLENKLAEREKADQPETLGPRPTLESVDFDEEKFAAALTTWNEAKRSIDAKREQQKAQEAEQAKAWEARRATYDERKAALAVPDYDDAEDVVREALSVMQQGVVIQGAKAPEVVLYALAKHPKKLAEIAKITDPINFAFAIAELEGTLKVQTRKPKTAPEKRLKSSAGTGGADGGNKTLEKLRAKAAKTGDMTEVLAYKRRMRDAAE